MWKPEVEVRYLPAYILRQDLSWNMELMNSARLANKSRDPLVSASPVLGLQAGTAMLGFLDECWRSET